ncbi:hypothetical protein BC937DRAFT_87340 [Endogone sp. FLAS-F59071]|nr:hypothetical protein BC937DRAFT_87340 [Endogone sp. FLAS-F59071]|eukprot:RUS23329.1 hypothetical protein BC937DRAFT_87340 [Endogone sp. FLAS-F59071]
MSRPSSNPYGVLADFELEPSTQEPKSNRKKRRNPQKKTPTQELETFIQEPKEPKSPVQEPKAPTQELKMPIQAPKATAQELEMPIQAPKTPRQKPKGPVQKRKTPAQDPETPMHESRISAQEPETTTQETKDLKQEQKTPTQESVQPLVQPSEESSQELDWPMIKIGKVDIVNGVLSETATKIANMGKESLNFIEKCTNTFGHAYRIELLPQSNASTEAAALWEFQLHLDPVAWFDAISTQGKDITIPSRDIMSMRREEHIGLKCEAQPLLPSVRDYIVIATTSA